ncbi:unnamed protein product [Callosobruchus maculatus]|uniref:Uncharacterized protein n=1 Tax=Callosobruchus maculatus TaxID=64391 RepID=A0A653DA36_CALMS|nr:unnamed protein product [Callosobruchus maculatus]
MLKKGTISAENIQETHEIEAKRNKKSTNRQYLDEYLNLGFTWTGDTNCQIPKCITCREKLANSAMVSAKLKRHFSTKHANLATKNKEYFKRTLEMQGKQAKGFQKAVTISDKAQTASYKVAELIALKQKPHTEGESLILPACCEIVKIMFGRGAEKELLKIPLLDDTIKRRIIDMSEDIGKKTTDKLSSGRHFAIQVDESTDVSGKAHLLAFVRFINENEVINQISCCRELTERTTGQDIFDSINSYMEKFKVSWENCVGICTDGAPSMLGSIKGFATVIRTRHPNVVSTHCFSHRESLIAKTLPPDLKCVLEQVVSVVNYTKSRPLKTRLFKQLCNSMESKYECLLVHTEVRWLSRGKVLCRVYELKKELLAFFVKEGNDCFAQYLGEQWCAKFAYLADIFNYLNCVNTSIQGKNENILTSTDKLSAFQKKINYWKNRITEINKIDMFPLLQNEDTNEIIPIVIEHLSSLQEKIAKYFPSLDIEKYDWVRNPFGEAVTSSNELSLREEEDFISLSSDRTL